MAKILLVEDDKELSRQVKEWLELNHHHNIEVSERGADALERLQFFAFDLVILDWSLPEMEGIDILRRYRDSGGKTPVLMLTGRDTIADIERGLITGADDYLTKPFDLREVAARVTALVRRKSSTYDQVLKVRDIELDTEAHKVFRAGTEIKLQPQEFALLEFLLRHRNDVFSVDALLQRAWPSEVDASPDTVRVCITRMRNKLDTKGEPSVIRTVHRVGYQINDD